MLTVYLHTETATCQTKRLLDSPTSTIIITRDRSNSIKGRIVLNILTAGMLIYVQPPDCVPWLRTWETLMTAPQRHRANSGKLCSICSAIQKGRNPQKLPLTMGDLDPHVIHGYLAQPHSTCQTPCRSSQPSLRGSRSIIPILYYE